MIQWMDMWAHADIRIHLAYQPVDKARQVWGEVHAGYRLPSKSQALGRLEAPSERAVAQADQVFCLREPYLGELDLF